MFMTQADFKAPIVGVNPKKRRITKTFLKLNRFLVNCLSTTPSTEKGQGSVWPLKQPGSAYAAYPWSRFPIFHEQRHRRVKVNERDLSFHLNSYFDFNKKIWKSGFFEIRESSWGIADGASSSGDYKFPVLGHGFSIDFRVFCHQQTVSALIFKTERRYNNVLPK